MTHRAIAAVAFLATFTACRDKSPEDSGVLESDSCLQHVTHEVDGVQCTLIEMEQQPLVWYGRDVSEGNPLQVRVMVADASLLSDVQSYASSWNAVLEGRDVLLAYSVDEQVSDWECALDSLYDLPQQTAGFCVATEEQWRADVPEASIDNAYYSRVNSPCDATIRGSLTLINPADAEPWGARSVGRAFGHMSSLVSVDDSDALLHTGWEGAAEPQDSPEGVCVQYQYNGAP